MTDEDPALIVAVYGAYAQWIGPFLESALAVGHRQFIIISDGRERASGPDLAKWAFESSHVQATEVEGDPDFASLSADPKLRPLAYLAAWRRGYRLLRPMQRFACVHIDTLLNRHLGACWREAKPVPFGLAAPIRRVAGRWVFDPALLCGSAAPIIETEMNAFVREATRLSLSAEREQVVRNYGSVESAALAMLHARSEEGTGTIIAQLGGGPTPWLSADDAQAGVVHFRGVVPPPTLAIGRRWRDLGDEYATRREGVTS